MPVPREPVAMLLLAVALSALQAQQLPTSSGADLLKSGKPGEARDAFELILQSEPGNADARRGEVAASERLALDARAAGQMEEALRHLLRAQSYAPQNPRLLYDLGILEDEMRLFLDADETLAPLEQLNPNEPNVLYAIARVKLDLGQLAPAEAKLQAYLKLRPEDASAHYALGRVYQLGLQVDKARAEFQRSIELKPVQTEAYYQLGDLALQQASFEEAIAAFGKTLLRNPRHGGALAGTGQAYFKQKEYEQAVEFLDRAIAAAPDYQPGHYYLGLTFARMGRKEDSARELALASELAEADSKKTRSRLRLNPSTTNP